jgi:hypothetical protein
MEIKMTLENEFGKYEINETNSNELDVHEVLGYYVRLMLSAGYHKKSIEKSIIELGEELKYIKND